MEVAVYPLGGLPAFALEGVHVWLNESPVQGESSCIRLSRNVASVLQVCGTCS